MVLLDAYNVDSAGFGHKPYGSLSIEVGRHEIQLSDIKSVWWRQKAKPQVPSDSVVELYNYGFVQREWNTIFDYLAAKTDSAFSINDRQKGKLAENKAFQLEIVSELGINMPQTIITSRCDAAIDFFESRRIQRCVYKSFSPYMPPNATMAYTTELEVAELSRREFQETIDTTPGIFQELIEADHELRVTVVGDEVFTARIDTPNRQLVDWRSSIFENKYSLASLPMAVEDELLRFHARMGLVFAAYDFIVSKNHEIFFLEANPAGQWMWLEQQLGSPISAAIGSLLRTPEK